MPEYVAKVTVRVTVNSLSSEQAWQAALEAVHTMMDDAREENTHDHITISHLDKRYAPANISETMASRQLRRGPRTAEHHGYPHGESYER